MNVLNLREPVSAWSHGAWFVLSLLGTLLLWRRAAGDRARQVSLLIYGLSLAFCSAASTLYHGVRTTGGRMATFALVDYVGIYFLIAGTYTPIAWGLLSGWRRRSLLAAIWLLAIAGTALRLASVDLPPWLSTGLYLVMGWGSVFFYFEAARRYSHRVLLPIPIGGLFYSVGAAFNLLNWPALWPGVFMAHELFHLFVIAGSVTHFRFILDVVVPAPPPAVR